MQNPIDQSIFIDEDIAVVFHVNDLLIFNKSAKTRVAGRCGDTDGLSRVAVGSDRKQFFSSDSTKNKNESDPI